MMLVGRRELVDDIDELAALVTPDGKRRVLRPVKIVQLIGPPFSGKTELLAALADRYGGSVPVGWHDFAHDRQELADYGILNLLIFLMGRPRDEFGRLTFPRLLSTLIAMRQDTGASRDEAVRNVTQALEDPRSVERVRSIVTSLAADATRLVEQTQQAHLPGGQLPGSGLVQELAPDIVLAAMRRTGIGRRTLMPLAKAGLGPWPGMTSPGSLYETLADIAFHLRDSDPRLRAIGAAQPWAAFLADVRAGYDQPYRNLCALLVLDNADHPAGRQFLRGLASACAERRRHLDGHDDAVPLLVICAGRQPIDVGGLWEIQHRDLPRMTPEDVSELAVRLQVKAPAAAEGAVYALSSGHTGTVQALLTYCAAKATYPYDLAPGVNVRRHLLPDVSDADFEALVTCSPATDVTQVEHLIHTAEEDGEDPSTLPGFGVRGLLADLGWLSGAEIDSCIRNLLMRQLARRPEHHDWAWSRACQRLRAYPPARIPGLESLTAREAATGAYYNLAVGDVAGALRGLEQVRAETSVWLAAFDWIITAPHPYSIAHDPWPLAQQIFHAAYKTLASTAIRPELTRLVVACWLAGDRQLDPWHQLDQHVARGYEDVAPLVGGDEFLRRALQYRDSAQWWRRSGLDKHPRPSEIGLTRAGKESP
jgi:hypothetical protein